MKIQRIDKNGGCEDEVTVSSDLQSRHKQREERSYNLGIGGGRKHLLEVEAPESVAAIAEGRQTALHMRKPVGHDLLSDLLLR